MMRRLNVGPRSILAFSIIVAIVIALGVVAIAQMRHLRESEQDVETNSLVSVRQAALMNSALLRIRLESLRGVTTTDPILREQTLNALGNLIQTFTTAIRDYGPLVSSDEERALYLRVQNDATSYSALFDQFEKLFRSGDSAAAVSLINTSIRPLADRLQSQLEGLSALNERDAKAIGVRAAQTYVTGLTWVYGLIATTIFITILMAFLLTKSLTVPIGDALRIAQRIARKDLSEEVVVSGADEAAGLLTALAEMQQNLKQTISHLADSSHQLAAAAEEMTAVIDEGNQGLIQQNDEVNQAATAVTEMSAAVDEVARNAEEAAGASLRTTTLTQSGLKHVAHTLTTIEQLAEAVAGSGEQVQTLSSKAQEISTVVEVIRSIAEQTNLLALNAAIEAARAGDQGRGFAVVADEVRALAHRTQQSTVEIERMIKTIQSDSAQAAQAMLRSTQMANESMGVAKHANGSLVEITDAIATINERNALIATAAEEQAQVAREIDRNITRIKDLSCRSAAGSTQTATASGEVSRLAVGLNQVVNQFVV